eukprot:7278861-Pyramimonas_sp.AAC.1
MSPNDCIWNSGEHYALCDLSCAIYASSGCPPQGWEPQDVLAQPRLHSDKTNVSCCTRKVPPGTRGPEPEKEANHRNIGWLERLE